MAMKNDLDAPPTPPCDDCQDVGSCVMRGALCRELIYTWLQGAAIKGCSFYEPIEHTYHGVRGVKA